MNAETIVIHYPLYPSKDKEDYVTYLCICCITEKRDEVLV